MRSVLPRPFSALLFVCLLVSGSCFYTDSSARRTTPSPLYYPALTSDIDVTDLHDDTRFSSILGRANVILRDRRFWITPDALDSHASYLSSRKHDTTVTTLRVIEVRRNRVRVILADDSVRIAVWMPLSNAVRSVIVDIGLTDSSGTVHNTSGVWLRAGAIVVAPLTGTGENHRYQVDTSDHGFTATGWIPSSSIGSIWRASEIRVPSEFIVQSGTEIYEDASVLARALGRTKRVFNALVIAERGDFLEVEIVNATLRVRGFVERSQVNRSVLHLKTKAMPRIIREQSPNSEELPAGLCIYGAFERLPDGDGIRGVPVGASTGTLQVLGLRRFVRGWWMGSGITEWGVIDLIFQDLSRSFERSTVHWEECRSNGPLGRMPEEGGSVRANASGAALSRPYRMGADLLQPRKRDRFRVVGDEDPIRIDRLRVACAA